MHVIRHLDQYEASEKNPLVLAIGNFDGVHLGHQRLIQKITERAKKINGQAAVLTFYQHPQHILHPSSKPALLTSIEHKLFLLSDYGVEICFLLSFTPELSRMEAEDFVSSILLNRLNVREIYLGHNARFGRDRRGDSLLMKELSEKLKFRYEEIQPVDFDQKMVSSSRLRSLVREGELVSAQKCLERPWSLLGEVVHGDHRGRSIGFPTANLKIQSEILPPFGVYAVRAREILLECPKIHENEAGFFKATKGNWHQAVMNYGYRPTFKEESQAIPEVHYLDFAGDLYGKLLEIQFFQRIRGEMCFAGLEPLKKQIEADVQKSREILQKST